LPGGWPRIWVVLFVLALSSMYARAAGAESMARSQAAFEGGPSAGRADVLGARVEDQDAALRAGIEEITAVGEELEGAQARSDDARARVGKLGKQTRQLEEQIAEQDRLTRAARAEYRDRARAAYKGQSLEGLLAFVGGWFGSGRVVAGDPRVASILLQDRQSLLEYEEAGQDLRNTRRQISQKQNDYRVALAEQQEAGAELRRREQALDRVIGRLGASKGRTEVRMHELEAAERARVSKNKAATGGGEASGRLEDDDLAAVEPISEREYMNLYRESARMYGFGQDWYILAAVGKVESDHGENMGPSSAGAMGPMQFLPSTWETSGVDGNGDGTANILDPEDAIPAAAGYLKVGGAPQDWYRALYSYNHADWYVEKVLAVAEAYRRLAHDEGVGPYI
jgi:peptidoglycan hydrolase CwlO-like protein